MAQRNEKKTATKKTKAKKAAPKKAAVKKTAVKKAAVKKATKKTEKNVSGYGSGGVDVVMSVDQIAKEAASISASAPKTGELEKLASDNTYLSINNLRAGYGKMEILHDFNLRIAQGQSLCLIGPNGAGKSTVLHSIFGSPIFFLARSWSAVWTLHVSRRRRNYPMLALPIFCRINQSFRK